MNLTDNSFSTVHNVTVAEIKIDVKNFIPTNENKRKTIIRAKQGNDMAV